MANPTSTSPGPLGHEVYEVSSIFLLLHHSGFHPALAFALSVVAVLLLRR